MKKLALSLVCVVLALFILTPLLRAGARHATTRAAASSGASVVFQRGVVDEQYGFGGSFYILDLATTDAPFFFGGGNHPNYSPDGTQIVFVDADGDLTKTPGNDYSPTNLVIAGGGSTIGGMKPKWSPDSSLIAFQTQATNANKIVVTNATCTSGHEYDTAVCNYTKLDQSSTAVNTDPDWYPGFATSGTTRIGSLVYVSKATSSATTGDIYSTDVSIDANGVVHEISTTNLTQSLSSYEAPSYSHDGSKIVFVQGGSLHLMDSDGNNQHPIVSSVNSGLIFGSDPTFSPDDGKIIWGDHSIYAADLVINANGSVSANNITQLSNGSADRSPTLNGDFQAPPLVAPPHGGLSETRLTVNDSKSATGTINGPVLSFLAEQAGRPAELKVRVQYSTTPEPNDSTNTSWKDLPTGTAGRMVYDPATRRFVLNTTAYPIQAGLYFRAVSEAQGYAPSISNYVGTFDGSQAGSHLPPLVMLMVRNGTLADLSFTVGAKAAPAGTSLRIQTSTTPADEASWTNLDDGQGGQMKRSTNLNFPDVFLLRTNKVTGGAGVFFRAMAKLFGSLESVSNVQGPFTLTADNPPAVNISLTNATSGSGMPFDPFVIPAGQIQFSMTATPDTTRPASRIVSLTPQMDGKTIQSFDHAPASVDYRFTRIGLHVLEAVAIDDLGAASRTGSGAVFLRVIPATGGAALKLGNIHSASDVDAPAGATGKVYTVATSGGVWSDSSTWRDAQGNGGVPGLNDLAIIKDASVRFSLDVTVRSVSIDGGRLVGPGNLDVTDTLTFVSGNVDDYVGIFIEAGALCELVNSTNINFNAGPTGQIGLIYNSGTLNIHGAGGILGFDRFRNSGTLHWEAPLAIPANALLDPTAGQRVLGGTNFLPIGGTVTGFDPNSLITQNGAGVINGTGSGLVGNAGGTLVGNAGGTLVGNAGGTVIARDGAGVISNDGGGLINQDGAGLIGQDGSQLVAAGAGNLIAAGAGNFMGGSATKPAQSRVSADETPSGFVQTGGETDLSAATIAGPVALNGGVLSGSGMIVGDLTNNSGYIAPGHSAGAVAVIGSFNQGTNGTLIVENGGATPALFDQLLVSGAATLGGKLDVKLINGYTPDVTDTYSPLSYSSVTGQFAAVTSNATVTVNGNGLLLSDDPAKPNPVLGQPKNISTRAQVLTNDSVMIGGFILSGSTSKTVVVRAIGPTLARYGVTGSLGDPTLELYAGSQQIATNDNWKIDDATKQSQEANIPQNLRPQSEQESVIVITLQPNQSYTAIVRGKGGATGVALLEVYDTQLSDTSLFSNISTRGVVGTAENVMIGGFIIAETGPSKVIVRAIGPSLTKYGVAGALQDPALSVYDSNGNIILEDNDWQESQASEIAATGRAPEDARESAIVATLAPGSYTAIVNGNSGSTGVALVEIYDLQ